MNISHKYIILFSRVWYHSSVVVFWFVCRKKQPILWSNHGFTVPYHKNFTGMMSLVSNKSELIKGLDPAGVSVLPSRWRFYLPSQPGRMENQAGLPPAWTGFGNFPQEFTRKWLLNSGSSALVLLFASPLWSGHAKSQVEFQLSVFYKGPGTGRPVCHCVWAGPVLSWRSVKVFHKKAPMDNRC